MLYKAYGFILCLIFLFTFIEAVPCKDDQLDRKDCSGALLDMLAEVASQTLHSDASVKSSPIKRPTRTTAGISCHLSNKRKVNHYNYLPSKCW
jgi:hypothetical protein